MTTYSKDENDHCMHLEKVFIRALKYGISLNPRKCNFGVIEGKLLGNLVCKHEVRIDPKRDLVILWANKFLRRFVTNFAKISRPISRMLKKGSEIKWDAEPSFAFQNIKQAIKVAPVLRAPNYKKPMHIFSFASFHTIAIVLL